MCVRGIKRLILLKVVIFGLKPETILVVLEVLADNIKQAETPNKIWNIYIKLPGPENMIGLWTNVNGGDDMANMTWIGEFSNLVSKMEPKSFFVYARACVFPLINS